MLGFGLCQLVLSVLCGGSNLWSLGYHGLFALVVLSLWLVGYTSCGDLYGAWLDNRAYLLFVGNGVEVGNQVLVDCVLIGDLLSLVLLVIMAFGSVAVVSFVYVEMWEDKEGPNFVILLVAFLAFMGVLAAGGNVMIFYLGGEGIGLVSLFLINFWSERARGFKAAYKVYCINKIGDFLLLAGICILTSTLGCTNFYYLEGSVGVLSTQGCGVGGLQLCDVVAGLMLVGGGVKSSQFGFHIWLLEAMEAPLGASALMHSSTLVVAGVYLILRLSSLLEASWVVSCWLCLWGAWTATFAAIVACYQYELKIVLAYSTISSMGFLFCLLGMHAYYEALLYLIVHAFIKIFLFLVVGAVMLYCGGCQDARWMGGLLNYVPLLGVSYVSGALGLAGLPYGSGYYCKSALWTAAAHLNGMGYAVSCVILVNALFTYVYLWRLGMMIFLGARLGHGSLYRWQWQSPLLSTIFGVLGCVVLYGGAVGVGLLEAYNYSGVLGWGSALSSYYDLRGELTRWGWYGLIAVYLAAASVAVGFGGRYGAGARTGMSGGYRVAVASNVLLLLYAVL